MRINSVFSVHMPMHLAAIILLLLGCETASADSARSVVLGLYKEFGWVALLSDDEAGSSNQALLSQKKPVLERRFTGDLASMLFAEGECQRKSEGELCRLDFEPLYGSQDPEAVDLKLIQESSGSVAVSYLHPPTGKRVKIRFLMKFAKGVWLIDDIVYENGSSIRRILEGKMESAADPSR